MCGIAGIVSGDRLTDDDRVALEPMLDALAHRGPDGRGTWTDPHAALGHTRLAIIDPDGGQQPICNEDGSVTAVVNGEIYNHRALRAELEARGHRFSSVADSETVVHLYEEFGATCVERLRGMFALAVWDSRARTLLLARDPIGIKPLYYARIGRRFLFASQLDGLLASGAIDRTVDLASLHNYLVYHYVSAPNTILRGVRKLEPAERLTVSRDTQRSERYWDLRFQVDERRRDEDWGDALRGELRRAVRSNLIADVPVGAFLSAGIDSSAVVAAMVGEVAGPARTYTVGFDNESYDERDDARRFAKRFQTNHDDECVAPDPGEIASKLCVAFDEPFADPSAIPTFYASRLASRHVKSVLSGDGGDELFAGYTRYTTHHRERVLRHWTSSAWPRRAIQACATGLPRRLRSAAHNLAADHDRAHYLSVAWFDPDETRELLDPDVARSLSAHDPFDALCRHFRRCESHDPLARSQYVDLKTWLADGVLCKTDRTSMANGLEVRVPLLDTRFAELAATLPNHLKIKGACGKYAFRRAMTPLVGRDVAQGRKRGFEVPLDDWFKGPLRSLARDALQACDTRVTQWISPAAIESTWTQLDRGRRGIGVRLWEMLMLELWTRNNLHAAPARSARPAISREWPESVA